MRKHRILWMAALSALVVLLSTPTARATPPGPSLSPVEELGKQLFFDKISIHPSVSCATCHLPSAGWVGGISGINVHGSVYRGAIPQRFGNRKPPTSAYANFSPIFHYDMVEGLFIGGMFWDGRATGEVLGSPLADQAVGPFLNPVEQNMPNPQGVCNAVKNSRYAALFEEVWGPGSLDCSDAGISATYGRIGLSIAAYEGSAEVSPFSSKFDAYWNDCIAAGNDPEACGEAEGDKAILDPNNVLTPLEWDGLVEFEEYCSACHTTEVPGPTGGPPLFTDFTYDNIGVPRNPENPFYGMDDIDINGNPINPDGDAFVDYGLGGFLRSRPEWASLAGENDGKFKVPTVRNVDMRQGRGAKKAYMHNGVFKTLKDVVHFYNTRDVAAENWPPPEVPQNVNREILEGKPMGNLELTDEAEDAIVAFMKTLTDGYAPRRTGPPRPAVEAQAVSMSGDIRFRAIVPGAAEITVHDILGRKVRSLGSHDLVEGMNLVRWDGRDDAGSPTANGIYFYRIHGPKIDMRVKAILVR